MLNHRWRIRICKRSDVNDIIFRPPNRRRLTGARVLPVAVLFAAALAT